MPEPVTGPRLHSGGRRCGPRRSPGGACSPPRTSPRGPSCCGWTGRQRAGSTASGSRFPNHCCDANLGWLDELTLVTMTEVAAGAELVSDYAMSIVEPEWFLRCHCPSYRCRQMVEGTDWRIPQLQARYAGWWAPHVQRLVEALGRIFQG